LSAPYRGYEDLRLLAWSADGKWIVAPDCAKTGSPVGLFLISVESGEKRRLTLPSTAYDDLDPIFAPDMKRLAFVRHSGDPAGDLYFLELTGDVRPNGMPKRLTFDHRRTSSPVWTGDGSALLFSRYSMPGSHSLWKIALSNPGRPEPLPISADNAFALAISPDGNRLVYTRETNNTNIWAVELPASQSDKKAGVPKLFIASSRQESTPSFSPDGQQIAFQSSRSGWQEIWIADRDGSHSHQLTELKGSAAGFPRWSPDGKKIVFHSRQQSYAQLILIDLASRRVSRPRYEAVDEFMPSWSHDGKRIYFASRRSGDIQVWQIPAAGGPATQLTKNGGWAPLESADGMFLFYTKPNAVGLWTMPVSGGGERQLLPDPVCAIGSAYAVGRKGIYFIQQANRRDRGMLAFLSLVTGQITALAELPRPIELGLTISPDETLLLYSQVDQVSSDLMLVENFR
jgi:Tol biopolymer transport system component